MKLSWKSLKLEFLTVVNGKVKRTSVDLSQKVIRFLHLPPPQFYNENLAWSKVKPVQFHRETATSFYVRDARVKHIHV